MACQLLKVVTFAALMGIAPQGVNGAVDDSTGAKLLAWKGATSSGNSPNTLWLSAQSKTGTAGTTHALVVTTTHASFSDTPSENTCSIYGETATEAKTWTTTATETPDGTLTMTAFSPSDLVKPDSEMWFKFDKLTHLATLSGTANTLDTVNFINAPPPADYCEVESVKGKVASSKYQIDLKVKCSGALVASGAKYVIYVLKDTNQPTDSFGASPTVVAYGSTSEITTLGTAGTGGYSGSSKIYHKFHFTTAAVQASAGASQWISFTVSDSTKALSKDAIIFATADSSSDARTHYSKGTFTCANATDCPAATGGGDSASRFVSLASIPALAFLFALFQ